MAITISEPDAGSAATDMTTAAVRQGDHYIINGMKRWCSGAGHAEQYLVYVRLNDERGARAIGALVVDRDTDGLTLRPPGAPHGLPGHPLGGHVLRRRGRAGGEPHHRRRRFRAPVHGVLASNGSATPR